MAHHGHQVGQNKGRNRVVHGQETAAGLTLRVVLDGSGRNQLLDELALCDIRHGGEELIHPGGVAGKLGEFLCGKREREGRKEVRLGVGEPSEKRQRNECLLYEYMTLPSASEAESSSLLLVMKPSVRDPVQSQAEALEVSPRSRSTRRIRSELTQIVSRSSGQLDEHRNRTDEEKQACQPLVSFASSRDLPNRQPKASPKPLNNSLLAHDKPSSHPRHVV